MRLLVLWHTFVSLWAAAPLLAEEKRVTSGPSSVWGVEKNGHVIYLAGTIHLLREKDYPLPGVFEQAYRDSVRLVFELPPGSEGDGEIIVRMRQLGTYDDGTQLADHVGVDALRRVEEWARKSGQSIEAVRQCRPWFL